MSNIEFNLKKFIQTIFSIKNEEIRKIITILGFKIKFKTKRLIRLNILNDAQKTISSLMHEEHISEEYKKTKFPLLLSNWYYGKTGEILDLNNPQTFNEKIQWLKLYDSTPIKTRLADKYLVREWVKDKIGEEYLIPLLGVWDNFDEIDFDKLPDKFVLKCNHGCGYNIIVKNKSNFDKASARSKINKWMNENYAYRSGFELHYSSIPRKIIAEKYIENSGNDLYDYKFWCFDGKVKYIQFLSERNTNGLKMAFYDKDWNKQDFVYSYPINKKDIPKPNNLEFMIQLAEKLSNGFSHVRVDFYRLDDGSIYFGEMTFTSSSGTTKIVPETFAYELGQQIKLPFEKEINIERDTNAKSISNNACV